MSVAEQLPRIGLPVGNVVRLSDRRRLLFDARRTQAMRMAAPGTFSACGGQVAVYGEEPHGLLVIASIDPTHHGDLLHVSFSYRDHLPSWEDVKVVRDAFYPDTVDVMMVLPRKAHYVNIHEFTFHLQQTPVGWGVM